MTPFQQEILDKLKYSSRLYLVGGVTRDQILEIPSKDVDVVIQTDFDILENQLKNLGYIPLRIGARHQTISVFEHEDRVDFNFFAGDLTADALRRDFTINAIYQDVRTGEMIDPLGGMKDIQSRRLRACGDAENCFKDDPIRILRMVRFSTQYDLEIDDDLLGTAQELIRLLANTASERISEELGKILVLEDPKRAIFLLDQIGYWQVYLPELWRLKGLVQNRHHTKDAWEHSIQVVENLPPILLLRLAGLFHDMGKWETASHECNLWGKCETEPRGFKVGDFRTIGRNLGRFIGQHVEINGARLDHYPDTVQVKRIKKMSASREGFEWVHNGKRHFLGHEEESGKLVRRILPRFRFSMGLGRTHSGSEKELIWLVENHMNGNLAFMAELKGELKEDKLKGKARKFAWQQGWNGRNLEVRKVKLLLDLWRADFHGGKQRSQVEKENFERILRYVLSEANIIEEKNSRIPWVMLEDFAEKSQLKGREYGEFKEYLRRVIVLDNEEDFSLQESFLEAQYRKFLGSGTSRSFSKR